MSTRLDQRISDAAARLFVKRGSTQLTISELAHEANVARGTLYRNIGSVEGLFDRVVADLGADMYKRVSTSLAGIDDPAARLDTRVRLWVRYAHQNPTMGHFAVRFGLSDESLREWMTGPLIDDIGDCVAAGRSAIAPSSTDTIASLVLGTTISAMWMVLEGHLTWREAGSSIAEFLSRALSTEPTEAHEICMTEPPRRIRGSEPVSPTTRPCRHS